MIERDKEYYNQKISELYAVIENQEKIIRDLQEDYNNELDENLKLSELWLKSQEENKQLKEGYKRRLEDANHILELQGQKGNYDYDDYMLGLYNGMEYVIALMEQREFKPIDGHNVKFTNRELDLYESVIDEVSEEIKDLLGHWKGNDLVERDLNELLEILDKVKGSDK